MCFSSKITGYSKNERLPERKRTNGRYESYGIFKRQTGNFKFSSLILWLEFENVF